MRRGQAGSRAIGPDDRIARQEAAPAVIAAHIGALRGCRPAPSPGRRPRDRATSGSPITSARSIVMPPPQAGLPLINRRASPVFGSRLQPGNPAIAEKEKLSNIIQSVVEIIGPASAVPCKSPSCPFKRGHPERWPSGLRRTLGKRVCGKPYRGFESHSLRHGNLSPSRTATRNAMTACDDPGPNRLPRQLQSLAGRARPDHPINGSGNGFLDPDRGPEAAAPAAFYSITSSAPLMSEGENSSPSILAAFRLMKSSTFVTSWTGRSEGFSPLRIRPA